MQDLARDALVRAMAVKESMVEARGLTDLGPLVECWRAGENVATVQPDPLAETTEGIRRVCAGAPGAFGSDRVVAVTEMVYEVRSLGDERPSAGEMQADLHENPLSTVRCALLAHAIDAADEALACATYEYAETSEGVRVRWGDPEHGPLRSASPVPLAAVVRESMRSGRDAPGLIPDDRMAQILVDAIGGACVVDGRLIVPERAA